MKKIIENTYKVLNSICEEAWPVSIDINENRAELGFSNKDISVTITDIDMILFKMIDNRYVNSKRIMFGITQFLSIPTIHEIEDFILYI